MEALQKPVRAIESLEVEAFQATDMASVQAKMQEPDRAIMEGNLRNLFVAFCRCLLRAASLVAELQAHNAAPASWKTAAQTTLTVHA